MTNSRNDPPAPEDVPVVILCGGKGLRLRPMTEETPKPLLRVGDRPIVQHIMDNFTEHGFTNFLLCVGYMSDEFFDHFRNHADERTDDERMSSQPPGSRSTVYVSDESTVTVLETGLESGLAERISRALERIEATRAIVTYGDTLADVDVSSLWTHHERHSRSATITGVQAKCPYGVLRGDGSTVSEFNEKPLLPQRVNGGFFVFDDGAFDYFDSDSGLVAVINEMASDGELEMYEHDGFFDGVDTHKDLSRVREIAQERTEMPWIDYCR